MTFFIRLIETLNNLGQEGTLEVVLLAPPQLRAWPAGIGLLWVLYEEALGTSRAGDSAIERHFPPSPVSVPV